jgi:hypothetical protein
MYECSIINIIDVIKENEKSMELLINYWYSLLPQAVYEEV